MIRATPTGSGSIRSAENFKHVRVSDLILVNRDGVVVEGDAFVNQAAFAIHSQVHEARPEIVAAAHAHSLHGKAWSSLGRLLDPLTQDACAFYEDHSLFDDYTGVVLDPEEGKRIAHALGENKAVILRNHGLLTTGVLRRRGRVVVHHDGAHVPGAAPRRGRRHAGATSPTRWPAVTHDQVGSPIACYFSFQPLWDWITREEPDLFD